jgi:methyl-accepting chemotaxis protein
MKNATLSFKFMFAFLAMGLGPFIIVGIISLFMSRDTIEKMVFKDLTAISSIKKKYLHEYFENIFTTMEMISQTQDIQQLYEKLSEYQQAKGIKPDAPFDVNSNEYNQLYNDYGKKALQFWKASGLYDIFIICGLHGHVMFTGAKESDLGTNLNHGQYKNTSLARVWREVVKEKKLIFADFEPYEPSGNEPQAFAGYPIYNEAGEFVGVIVFQLSSKHINDIMQERSGMGDTGETYLVGKDNLMRSDSFLDPVNHSIKASFENPDKGKIDSESTREAFIGKTGEKIIKDYRGNSVLSHFTPIEIEGVTWAFIAEVDEDEAFKPITRLTWFLSIIGFIGILTIVTVSFILTRSVVRPIKEVVDGLTDIAEGEGDLTRRLKVSGQNEVGQLALRFNNFIEKLQIMIQDISANAHTLASASTELSTISQQMSVGSKGASSKANSVATAAEQMSANMVSISSSTEESSTNVNMVATASEEMTATISEIAENTEKARSITHRAVSESKSASATVEQLGKAAQEIGKVTESITEISEQTNLLALNATIEAARAGDAGKGFAVVAYEIKELAKQASQAADEIKTKIDSIQSSTAGTVKQIELISSVINDVNEIVSAIATAVEEQSITTKEIARNVSQAAIGIGEVTENVAQSSVVSKEIAKDIAEVNKASRIISDNSSQVNISADELSRLSEQLKLLVSRFKI